MENRPLSPHIQIYKWHISSLLSISHRISGIINIFAIKPSKIVGELKNEIKNQILDGKIKNKKSEALKLLTKLGKLKGLTPVN